MVCSSLSQEIMDNELPFVFHAFAHSFHFSLWHHYPFVQFVLQNQKNLKTIDCSAINPKAIMHLEKRKSNCV